MADKGDEGAESDMGPWQSCSVSRASRSTVAMTAPLGRRLTLQALASEQDILNTRYRQADSGRREIKLNKFQS